MMKLNLSILQKMLLGIFTVLLSVFIAFFQNYHQTKIQAKRNVLKDVATIADSYKAGVCQFLEITNHRAQDFSSDGFVRTQLSRLLQGRKSSFDTLSKYLIENKIVLDKSIKTIHILSMEGRIVASTDRLEIGKDVSQEIFFLKGKNSLTVMESSLGPTIIIATPIPGLNKKRILGVLVNFIQLSRINNILAGECLMEQQTALSKKEKWRNMGVYLVNKNKLMIASSGFAKDDALKRTVKILPVLTSMTSNKELSGFYRNYRGIMVAGASAYIPSLEWLLVAEIDEGEALSQLPVLLVSASVPFVVILIVDILLILVFYKKTILPICILTDNTKSISLGNYNIVTPVLSNDEVGRLCESFNGMAKEIQVKTELLEKSRHCLAEAQRIAHIGSWEWDIVNNKVYWSDDVYRIFGLSPHEFDATYESVLERTHPDDKAFVKASVDNALYEKKPYDLNYRILLKDTAVRFIHAMIDVISDEITGRVIRMAGTVQDITAHKRMEEDILQTKNRLEFILRVSPTMIYSAQYPDFTRTFMSENVRAQLGYEAQQFVHHQEFWFERVHPEDLPNIISELSHLAKVDHLALEYRFLHKDGTYRFMYDELNLVRDAEGRKEGNPVEIIGFWIDVTERKKSEDEQENLKEQLYHVQRL